MKVQIYEWLKCGGYNSFVLRPKERLEIGIRDINNTSDFGGDFLQLYSNDGRQLASVFRPRNKFGVWTKSEVYRKEVEVTDGLFICHFDVNKAEDYDIEYEALRIGASSYDVFVNYIKSDTLHLRPCRLLSPYTSAQGKLHPIGECAMIDINTNTLYFNQGSGAFSVEGEAGEIIDTTPFSRIMHKRNEVVVRLRESLSMNGGLIMTGRYFSSNTKIKQEFVKIRSTETALNNWDYSFLAGVYPWSNDCFGFYIYDGRSGVSMVLNNGVGKSIPELDNGVHSIEMAQGLTIVDGNEINTPTTTFSKTNVITIGASTSSYIQNQFLCNRFIIEENGATILHLHPCDLLHHPTLPPQSCMIDLLTGQLYTNQGTGQFSCEGADLGIWQSNPVTDMVTLDANKQVKRILSVWVNEQGMLKRIWEKNEPWEEHRWLVGDGVAWIDSGIADDDIDRIIRFKARNSDEIKDFDDWIFGVREASIQSLDGGVRKNAINNIFLSNKDRHYHEVNGDYEVEFGKEYYKLNGVRTTTTTRELTDTTIGVYWNNGGPKGNYAFRGSFAYFDIGDLHLHPVLLSRNILPNEDANGRARFKGEAVMVDKMKYKLGQPFVYGNIASSGSFSVSDYLIEGEDYEVISGIVGNDDTFIGKIAESNPIDFKVYKLNGTLIGSYPNGAFQIIYRDGQWGIFDNSTEGTRQYKMTPPASLGRYHLGSDGVICNDELLISAKYLGRGTWEFWKNTFGEISTNNLNLIPVRLKKAIEPTCTHNGKGARQGEIGFFDKVSGRFYGNDGKGEFGEYVP